MGFRQDGFMTVWSVEPGRSGSTTKVRLSASRKNKKTDEYEQDFSGFCTFIGKAHENAAALKKRDRIKILECDVGTSYDREKKIEYVNYRVFDFEMADGSKPVTVGKRDTKPVSKRTAFDEGGDVDDSDLPF